ncbi:MAG: KH domain-containing protein [Chloroflexota bacterium]
MSRRNTPNTRRQETIIKYIAQRLVDDPDAVRLVRRVEGRTVVLELSVAAEDVGRVIGKNGRVAESIRALLDVVTPEKDRVILKIQ